METRSLAELAALSSVVATPTLTVTGIRAPLWLKSVFATSERIRSAR